MKIERIIFLCGVAMCMCLAVTSFGQIVPRVEGLEKDSVYMSLLEQEKMLVQSQDSLQEIIDGKRALLSKDPANREQYTREILNMENMLFDIRNQLGMITTKSNIIEKEFILNQMNNVTTGADAGISASAGSSDKRNLLSNDFFKENVSSSELALMNSAFSIESEINRLSESLKNYYDRDKAVEQEFREAEEKAVADSLQGVHKVMSYRFVALDDSLHNVWDGYYQTKLDNYNRLLDKINAPSSVLEELNEKSRNLRSEESDAPILFSSAAFAMYPRQRLLLLDYEVALAEQLGFEAAADSLRKVADNIALDKYEYIKVKLPQWIFIDYSPITIGGVKVHSTDSPIPQLVVPTKGSLYKIDIGTYPKLQTSYSVFRKIYPIEYEEIEDGKFRYYAGSYHTEEEAQKDYDRLRRLGMKVSIARWEDGKAIGADGQVIDRKPVGDVFRIEIPILTEDIRAAIDTYAPEKELSKVDIDGKSVYSVGVYDKLEDAQAVAEKLGASAKVVGVKLAD